MSGSNSFSDEKVNMKSLAVEQCQSVAPAEVDPSEDLQRGLKPRHVNMFAIAGSIGTGLIIGSGKALANGGPGSLLIAYLLMGSCVYFVMTALAEMAVFAPMTKGFSGYATRYCDPALGFATGWNYFFKYIILLANNLTATGLIIGYWRTDINVGVWIAVFGSVIVGLNLLHVRYFGEAEFWMAVVKIIVIVGLILFCFITSLGGSPSGRRIGFHYWNDPGAFAPYIYTGSLGRFLGVWSCIVQGAFMFMGTEVVGITFGEAPNPRKTIPRAIKQTIYRIAFFYVGGAIVLGMSVPYTNNLLLGATKSKTSAAASPFVIAIRLAGVKYLPDIINGCLLIFVISFANSDIYIASRTAFGLAKDRQAPALLKKTTNAGVPIYAVFMASGFILLAFLNVSSSSATIFGYFVSLSTVLGLINWINLLTTYFSFLRGLKAQGIDRESMPYRGPLQPYGAYFAFAITAIVIIFNGYSAFIPKFKLAQFITSYIGIVVYLVNILVWKFWKGTRRVRASEMDLYTGRREYDQADSEEKTSGVAGSSIFQRLVSRVKSLMWGN